MKQRDDTNKPTPATQRQSRDLLNLYIDVIMCLCLNVENLLVNTVYKIALKFCVHIEVNK